ncbi:MAG: hypothetical protein KC777_04340 [Cyanobacteria bacterium HKST-UBA02]|nr:hypothetical protein [Cyanobacteria bacterium HKST-UBA02]
MEIFVWLERVGLFALLVFLEIALSVDNLEGLREAFAGLRSKRKRQSGRHLELLAAWICLSVKVGSLIAVVQLLHIFDPWLAGSIFGCSRHFLLTFGGVFLIFCGVSEIRSHFDEGRITREISWSSTPGILLLQILVVDLMLSVDSIVVAISVSSNLMVIAVAMLVAQIIVSLTGDRIENFFKVHRGSMTVIMAFIVLIGAVSMVRGLGLALAEECLLAALVFGFAVEWLNQLREKKQFSPASSEVRQERTGNPVRKKASPGPSPVAAIEAGVFSEHDCGHCLSPTASLFPFCLRCGQEQSSEVRIWSYRYSLEN